MLRAGIMGAVSDKQRDGLNKIIQTNQELTRIVSDLLTQAQLEVSTLDVFMSEINVEEVDHPCVG